MYQSGGFANPFNEIAHGFTDHLVNDFKPMSAINAWKDLMPELRFSLSKELFSSIHPSILKPFTSEE
jgi:hypothetical protein